MFCPSPVSCLLSFSHFLLSPLSPSFSFVFRSASVVGHAQLSIICAFDVLLSAPRRLVLLSTPLFLPSAYPRALFLLSSVVVFDHCAVVGKVWLSCARVYVWLFPVVLCSTSPLLPIFSSGLVSPLPLPLPALSLSLLFLGSSLIRFPPSPFNYIKYPRVSLKFAYISAPPYIMMKYTYL